MRNITGGFWLALLVLGGCSSPSALKDTLPRTPPDWTYRKQAIDLHLKADPQLNLFHQTPHTLLLCIYHLRDPNPFNQLRDEQDGLQRLLDCGRFDPSVVYSRRVVIQPGQELRESLDRPEGARQIAIAAGYFAMRKEAVTRSFPVPLAEERRGEAVAQIPQQLKIELYLGPRELEPPR